MEPPDGGSGGGGGGDASRAAFTLSLVARRRDGIRITCAAPLAGGARVFVGLDNGVVEEHAWAAAAAAWSAAAAASGIGTHHHHQQQQQQQQRQVLRLVAERRVFPRGARVEAIAPLDAAARLAVLSDDGQVALVATDALAVAPLPAARGAVALAAQPSAHLPVLLAVVVKAGRGRAKLLVFSVLPGANVTRAHEPAVQVAALAVPAAASGVAWVGRALLLAVPGGYMAATPLAAPAAQQQGGSCPAAYALRTLADHLDASLPTMVAGIPDLQLGLMAWEEGLVLVADAAGAAVREPLQLPAPPLALAAAGAFVVAACDDAVYVFDRLSARAVQRIPFAHDDAHVRLRGRLPAAADAAGRLVVLCTSEQVLRLEPVAMEQQVRELLKRRRVAEALALVDRTLLPPFGPEQQQQQQDEAAAAALALAQVPGAPPPWHHVARAHAGLLLLLDLDFRGALALLAGLPLAVWQPCQLFPLFPGATARWLPRVPDRTYWGLHASRLPPLPQLLADALELRAATAPLQQQQQQQQQRAEDVEALVRRGIAAVADYLSAARRQQQQQGQQQQGQQQQGQQQQGQQQEQQQQGQPLACADGVDLLLLQLLCDADDAAAVEALVADPGALATSAVAGAAAEAALRDAGRRHALALLAMARGRPADALAEWRALAAGDVRERPCRCGAVADADGDAAGVAVAAAAAAMAAGPERVPLELLLPGLLPGGDDAGNGGGAGGADGSAGGALAWLLARDGAAGLRVLEARPDLPPEAVLRLLDGLSAATTAAAAAFSSSAAAAAAAAAVYDLRWQYLYHRAHRLRSADAATHTRLGAALLSALAAALAAASAGSAGGGGGCVRPEQLAAMAHRLPLAFAPNQATASASAAARAGSRRRSTRHQHGAVPASEASVLPPASALAASVAAVSSAGSREAQAGGSGSGSAAAWRPHLEAYQHQHHHQRARPSLGALAGDPVELRRGPAAAAFGSGSGWLLSLAGGTAAASTASHHTASGAIAPTGLHQQPLLAVAEDEPDDAAAALRALPPGLGPWPLEPPESSTAPAAAAAADTQDVGASAADSDSGPTLSPPPPAAAATGGGGEADAAAEAAALERVLLLRCVLCHHLQASLLYDAPALLARARALPLAPERALLHSRLGRHGAALRLLALAPPRLVDGAIAYARALASPDAWLLLLQLFLDPAAALAASDSDDDSGDDSGIGRVGGAGDQEQQQQRPLSLRQLITDAPPPGAADKAGDAAAAAQPPPPPPPDYAAASRVLNAEGAGLDPAALLGALPGDLPLPLAGGLLGRVLGALQHRRRDAQVVKALHSGARLAAHAELSRLQAGRVLLTDDTACHGCARPIGRRVFYRFPSGVLMCGRCSGAAAAGGNAGAAGDAVDGAGR